MQKRCPWCGKKINIKRWNRLQRKTPSRFIFQQCEFCGQYFGQYSQSRRVICLCLSMLCSCFLPLLWAPLIYLVIPIVFLLAMVVIQIPLERMTQEENLHKSSFPIFKAEILWNNLKIKKKYIYAQIKEFDNADTFSLVSPIFVTKVDKKEGEIYFYFLYDHEKNTRTSVISLYDDGVKIAEIKVYDKSCY